MIVVDFIEKAKKLYPHKEALICENMRMTYAEFYTRSKRLAVYLQQNAVKRGDVISVLHYNCHYFMEACFAAAWCGAILNPINVRLSPNEILYILENAESKILITNDVYQHTLESVKNDLPPIIWTGSAVPETVGGSAYEKCIASIESPDQYQEVAVDESDTAHLYYTSGTTGKPKGVPLSHKNIAVHSLCAIAEFSISDSDNWLHAAPMFHLADAWAMLAFTAVGAKHTILNHFTEIRVFELIEKERVTISNMIPTMLNRLVNSEGISGYDLSSLRVMLSGGAPIAPELVRTIMEKLKCDYVQTYGMTETSPYLTVSTLKKHLKQLPPADQLHYKAKTGREFLGVHVRVISNDGSDVEANDKEVGEIIVRGDSVIREYWKLPEETNATVRDGWLYTGDMATIDEEGYVTIVDRKKDIIITGGENVYSTEVEHVIYEHPAVLETAVVGIPDLMWGEAVKAFVVLKKGESATEDDIISFVKERTARFKAPKRVEFLTELPKTGSGKIAKQLLKDKHQV